MSNFQGFVETVNKRSQIISPFFQLGPSSHHAEKRTVQFKATLSPKPLPQRQECDVIWEGGPRGRSIPGVLVPRVWPCSRPPLGISTLSQADSQNRKVTLMVYAAICVGCASLQCQTEGTQRKLWPHLPCQRHRQPQGKRWPPPEEETWRHMKMRGHR